MQLLLGKHIFVSSKCIIFYDRPPSFVDSTEEAQKNIRKERFHSRHHPHIRWWPDGRLREKRKLYRSNWLRRFQVCQTSYIVGICSVHFSHTPPPSQGNGKEMHRKEEVVAYCSKTKAWLIYQFQKSICND